MLYFVINNTFHWTQAMEGLAQISNRESVLVLIPHKLDLNLLTPQYCSRILFHSPFIKKYGILRISTVRILIDEIRSSLTFSAEDTVIIFTEYEILNHVVACYAKEKGARVILWDEGSFVLMGNIIRSQRNSIALWLSLPIRRVLLRMAGIKQTKLRAVDGTVFPLLKDSIMDLALGYFPIEILRRIRYEKIQRPGVVRLMTRQGVALFSNQDIYNLGGGSLVSFNEYVVELKVIMGIVSKNFDRVYFKFHPREPSEIRIQIKVHIEGFRNVCFVEDNSPVEMIIENFSPSHVVTYNSLSAINLAFYGVAAIFLYHITTAGRELKVCESMDVLLDSLGWVRPKSLDDISPNFDCGVLEKINDRAAPTLADVL